MILDEFNLTDYQLEQFKKYYAFLIEENEKFNLTSIIEENEVYIKHFYDSLKIKDIIDFSKINNFLDIGSGAGFPGIPIKIAYPHLKISLLEPTQKRINFLKNVINILGLQNVELINARAEDEIVNRREKYDVVTARAVANLPTLLELSVPYVKVNGWFLGLKASSFEEELSLSYNAMKKLHCIIEKKYIYELPFGLGTRVILKFIKEKETNQIYPRKYAVIKKNHL